MSAMNVEFGPELSERRVIFWAALWWRDSDYLSTFTKLCAIALILKKGTKAQQTADFLADLVLERGTP